VAHHSIGQLRQPLARHDPVIIVGVRELEHIFCQIDCNSRSMHGGLLSFGQLNAAHPVWHFDADIPARGVHSIIQPDRCDGRRYYHAVRGSGRLTQALGGNRRR